MAVGLLGDDGLQDALSIEGLPFGMVSVAKVALDAVGGADVFEVVF